MNPILLKSYKNAYPFKIGTTSFIYPDEMGPNVKLLGPFLDEIELLFFESNPALSPPTEKSIAELKDLGAELGITYNIHLPLDIDPGGPDPKSRDRDIVAIRRIIALTAPLNPSCYTLHLPIGSNSACKATDPAWQEHICESLHRILASGIESRALCIETLDYPIQDIDAIIRSFDLSVCIDTGHLLKYGFDLEALFARYSERTPLIHLHGIRDGRDHAALQWLKPDQKKGVMKVLQDFTGVLSLEVFAFEPLQASLQTLETWWAEEML